MNFDSQNTYPLPACWYSSYEEHAKSMGYSRFPTAKYLQLHPNDAAQFTLWIWHRLLTTTKNCRGSENTQCKRCLYTACAEDAALAALSQIVAEVNPTLSDRLMDRARQLGYQPEQPDPYHPDKTPAVAMPKPNVPIKTSAIAKG